MVTRAELCCIMLYSIMPSAWVGVVCAFKKVLFSHRPETQKTCRGQTKDWRRWVLDLVSRDVTLKAFFVCLAWEFFFNTFDGFFPKGGGTFDDSDLYNVGQGDYKPEGGKTSAPGLAFYFKLWSNAETCRPSWGNTYKININFKD